MNERYINTTTATQNDTLDEIAHRIYGDRSNDVLPELIELNSNLNPFAVLPMGAEIVLPEDNQIPEPQATLKLWD